MHYYTFNIGDYRRQTHHLTLVEHGIYRSLLDTYYLKEEPLCADHAQLMRSHSIRTEEEQTAFNNVISDFFTLHDEGYRHHVCDRIIDKYHEKSEKARKSAAKRWEGNANAMRTHSEGNANHKPITNNHKPIKRFTPPTLQEVTDYCAERNNGVNPSQFISHYEANGWMRGKNKIKCWKACVRTWEKPEKKSFAKTVYNDRTSL
jgi:uncharacterized protein YdaU (DUF1376 family)